MIQRATFHSSVHLHIETLMTFPSSAQGDQALTALPSLTIFLNLEGVQECQQAQSLSSVILVSLMNHLHSLKRVVEHLHIHLKAWLVLVVLLKILHFFFVLLKCCEERELFTKKTKNT